MTTLTHDDALGGKDFNMLLEKNRLDSFKNWPFKTGLCIKENMAKAGFYHCPHEGDFDCVRCFCCLKEMCGWLESDDPWHEHQRSAGCIFAKMRIEESQLTVNQFIDVVQHMEINRLEKRKEKFLLETQVQLDELHQLESDTSSFTTGASGSSINNSKNLTNDCEV